MQVIKLETKYIQHLEDTHFIGYARQLFFDNEKLYYKGMRQFMKDSLDPIALAKGDV